MENGFRTGALLGDLFLGKSDGSAYADQRNKNYQAMKLMEDARRSRSRNIAMDELTPEAVAAAYGVEPALGGLLSSQMRGQSSVNANALGMTPLQMQQLQMRQAVVDAGTPTYGAMQANLAGIDGKPMKVNHVTANGQQLNPYMADGEVSLTPLGRANEALLEERAGTATALGSKYQSDARSNRIKAEMGPVSRAKGGGTVNSLSAADHKLNFKSLADTFGATINSQWRTAKRNAEVWGVKNSQHLVGTAGDFSVPDDQKAAFMTQAESLGYEVIDEGNHVHLEEPPAGMGSVPVNKKVPEFSEAYARQAFDDARKAIASGLITKEAARKRLIDAGMKRTAGRL